MIYQGFSTIQPVVEILGISGLHQPVSCGVTMLQDPPEKPEGLDEAPKVLGVDQVGFSQGSFVLGHRKFKTK